ncbi:MAG: DNA replication/repair protein RecF [Abditibacteriota bacterium]|nr:DNA replication/repair protein RecF [Abditibacteriota bacterium]
MQLRKITIRNLRCIENLELETEDSLNMLLGSNAQGKSTVLEAVFLTCTSKSFRTGRDRELIAAGKEYALVSVEASREKRNPVKIELALSKSRPKALRIDGAVKSRIPDLFGEVNCVIFSSEDVTVLRGEPKNRRHYLNLDISQIYPTYAVKYGEYKRVLHQRNTLLKEMAENPGKYPQDFLQIYDEKAASAGAALISKRLEYTDKLFTYAREFYKSIINSEKADFAYSSTVKFTSGDREEIERNMLSQLIERRESDIQNRTTGVGPHRDDITASIDGAPVKIYGSAGQQRCCALSLKLAQIYLTYDIAGEYPVVLLDDFASELDRDRQKRALDAARDNCQCFITATHLDREEGRVFSIDKGRLV